MPQFEVKNTELESTLGRAGIYFKLLLRMAGMREDLIRHVSVKTDARIAFGKGFAHKKSSMGVHGLCISKPKKEQKQKPLYREDESESYCS